MYTDPNRIHAPMFQVLSRAIPSSFITMFSIRIRPKLKDLKTRYREGKVGDVEVKRNNCLAINNFLDPIRERRKEFETDKGLVEANYL